MIDVEQILALKLLENVNISYLKVVFNQYQSI